MTSSYGKRNTVTNPSTEADQAQRPRQLSLDVFLELCSFSDMCHHYSPAQHRAARLSRIPNFGAPIGTTTATSRASQASLASAAAAVVLFVAGLFARRQSIWIDETTQLNGISLGPARMLAWLLGDPRDLHGVPLDRNPPISYFLGQLWSSVLGFDPIVLRWMGIVTVALGAACFVWQVARRLGRSASLAALGCVVLAPQVSTLAAEIRPYPLLLFFSMLAWPQFLGLANEPDKPSVVSWVALATTCALASFTHFFGLLMTGGLLSGLFTAALLRRKSVVPIVLTAGVLGLVCAGTLPFALQAAHVSRGGSPIFLAEVAGRTGRLLFRLLVSPAVATQVAAGALLVVGFAILVARAILTRETRIVALAALMAVALPAVLCFAAALTTSSFDALAPHYNAWMLPGVGLLAALGARTTVRSVGCVLAWVLVSALLATNLVGCRRLVSSDAFTHGPHASVMRLIESNSKPDTTVIIDESSAWAFVYFPLRYELGPEPEVFLVSSSAPQVLHRVDPQVTIPLKAVTTRRVLLMYAQPLQTKQLGRALRGDHLDEIGASCLLDTLRADRNWREVDNFRHVSFVGAQGHLFERRVSDFLADIPVGNRAGSD